MTYRSETLLPIAADELSSVVGGNADKLVRALHDPHKYAGHLPAHIPQDVIDSVIHGK